MNKRISILLILLTSVAIIGIVISQVYWIKNAFELKKDHFHKQVHMGLKAVSNNLFEMQNSHQNCRIFLVQDSLYTDKTAFENLNYSLIDSLIVLELIGTHLPNDYEFGVYHNGSSQLLGGKFNQFEQQIIETDYRVSLGCLRSGSPYYLAIYFPNLDQVVLKNMAGGFSLSALFVLIIGFSFVYTVIVTYRQKKINLMKNDFVNNMTHEFKTPIATVSLASEMLLRPEVQSNIDRTKKYAQIIYDENVRLRNQVEQVLQLAVLDKGLFKIRKKEMDVHKMLDDIIHNSEIFIHNRNGSITKIFSAARSKIRADKMHFTNIIHNLIDNANKYSPNPPEITIRTKNAKKGILISVEDKGIGIKPQDQEYIFKQFHRVHTGNIHDVKGFGLGLFYAEKMVKEHGGYIRLNSTFGIGSTFEIYLPFNELRNI
ncbi:MAG: HAMP domain-containing histidine kinase [Bacteroidales bacterium]|nr:HAMP domain-containing histidine kinase [Bacteroidales bacterium]